MVCGPHGALAAGQTAARAARPHPFNTHPGSGPMHEFQVLATFAVISAIYFAAFIVWEKLFMK